MEPIMRFHLSPEVVAYTPEAIQNRWSAGRAKVELSDGGETLYDEIITRTADETDEAFRKRCSRRGLQLVMAGGAR